MRILISTMPGDLHAAVVSIVLEQAGVDVIRLYHADFPARQRASFACDADGSYVEVSGAELKPFDVQHLDVVWNRRHMQPLPHPRLAMADRAFGIRETRAFSASLWKLCGPSAFWINPETAARQADSKPVQLKLAQRLGMTIPRTLISNDPARVRAFVAANAENCIYKVQYASEWTEGDVTYLPYTARVSIDQLPDPELLEACPGIYQRRVSKQFEVRAAFFGAECCAVRIDSQRTKTGLVDWRQAQCAETLPVESIELPETVWSMCRRMMAELGLVYGSFDFIVTPEDDWVFVEVNEAGQFLFLEAWCPEIPVLDIFCQFLQSRDPNFRYVAKRSVARFRDLEKDPRLEAIRAAEATQHLLPDALKPIKKTAPSAAVLSATSAS